MHVWFSGTNRDRHVRGTGLLVSPSWKSRPAVVKDDASEQARLGNLLVSTFVDPRRGRCGNALANGQYSDRVAKLCTDKTVGSWERFCSCHREVAISLWEVWGR